MVSFVFVAAATKSVFACIVISVILLLFVFSLFYLALLPPHLFHLFSCLLLLLILSLPQHIHKYLHIKKVNTHRLSKFAKRIPLLFFSSLLFPSLYSCETIPAPTASGRKDHNGRQSSREGMTQIHFEISLAGASAYSRRPLWYM